MLVSKGELDAWLFLPFSLSCVQGSGSAFDALQDDTENEWGFVPQGGAVGVWGSGLLWAVSFYIYILTTFCNFHYDVDSVAGPTRGPRVEPGRAGVNISGTFGEIWAAPLDLRTSDSQKRMDGTP